MDFNANECHFRTPSTSLPHRPYWEYSHVLGLGSKMLILVAGERNLGGGEGGDGSTPAKQWLSRTLGECLRHQHRSRNPIHPRYCIKSDRPDRFSKTTTMIRSHSGIAVEASKIVLAKGMQTLQNARVKKGERRMPVSPESWSIACLHWLSWYSPTIFKVVHTWLAGQINLPIYCPNMISNFANKVPVDFFFQPVTGTCQSWMGKGTK